MDTVYKRATDDLIRAVGKEHLDCFLLKLLKGKYGDHVSSVVDVTGFTENLQELRNRDAQYPSESIRNALGTVGACLWNRSQGPSRAT